MDRRDFLKTAGLTAAGLLFSSMPGTAMASLGSASAGSGDQASIDLVYALPEEQRRDLVERIETREALRQLSYMDEMGMGSRKYELVKVD